MKTKMKRGKAILGLAVVAIMIASVMAAMIGSTGAFSKGDGYNYITVPQTASQQVLIGQDLQFVNASGTPVRATVSRVLVWAEEWCIMSDSNGRLTVSEDEAQWTKDGGFYVNYENATSWDAKLSVSSPSMPLKLKIGTKTVSSIAVGSELTVDVSGINLFDNDVVDLVIIGPEGQIEYDTQNDQDFTDITVRQLRDWYGDCNLATAGWDIGPYTFQVETVSEYACGLDASSSVKNLELLKGEIAIEADTTNTVELKTVKITVTGVAGDNITVTASPCTDASFKDGIDDTPTSGCSFSQIIKPAGVMKYAIEFTDTGSFTIKAEVTSSPGGVRNGEYDTVDIAVSEKEVLFDLPSTAIIGDRITIKGTSASGTYVSVFVEDTLYPQLWKLVIADGAFRKEVTTTDVGMNVPGTVKLEAWIDCAKNPGDDPPAASADGSATILTLGTHLDAIISKTAVSRGDSFEVYGNASSHYAEIVAIGPEGGNGTGIDGLYGTTIVTVPTFCNYTNYNYYKKLKVDSAAENGTYTIIVLIPGIDGVYGDSGYSYIDNILDLDGKGPELGAIDVSNKTQAEIVAIIRDIINVTGSDDFMRIGNIVVTQFDTFDTCGGGYPSISGTHNGTITSYHDLNVSKIYTYSCPGTGGHTEYVAFYNTTTGEEIANGTWYGYHGAGDYKYIEFDSSFVLKTNVPYNYTIKTGSYPQIIHEHSKEVAGGVITCTEFIDANGKRYNNWIPAIGLE